MDDTQMTVSELITILCDKIKNSLEISDLIAELTNCNNCGKADCEYLPQEGDTVRINCPLWVEVETEEKLEEEPKDDFCEACQIPGQTKMENI